MRVIVIVIFISSFIFANNIICEDEMIEKTYKFDKLIITECNCNCTMQDNIFYINNLEKNIIYEIFGVSKINIQIEKINNDINPYIKYLLSNKEFCNKNIDLENDKIYMYSLIPNKDNYCYEAVGYINSNNNIIRIGNNLIINSKIQSSKQPLYKNSNENSKTKMYLIKDDVVEILEEKEEWIYILYITKDNKEIKAWIPKKALEKEGIVCDL